MNALLKHIKNRIISDGPLSVADYMSETLFNPKYGYYMTGDPIGKHGDFITAPEISQMFGELIGLWGAVIWQKIGAPKKINLVEMGPGRGTLIADALRAISTIPSFSSAIDIHIIETSPILERRQKRNLKALNFNIKWHKSFIDVPDGPLIFIANELFDVLPIQQFVKLTNNWVERKVGCNAMGQLTWIQDRNCVISKELIPQQFFRSKLGSVFELSQVGIELVSNITKSVVKFGGAALIIDYGHIESGIGDTLQAVKNHNYCDVLSEPGKVDLTAHVDFERLTNSVKINGGLGCGPVTQRDFLRRLGIETRAEQLKSSSSTRLKSEVLTGLNRLIGIKEMGNLFKVLAIIQPTQTCPEGFVD
jgi:SAM-dependent MidA family methyltransferase